MSIAVGYNSAERRRVLALRPRAVTEVVDRAALEARLEAIAEKFAADTGAMRKAAVEAFRAALELGLRIPEDLQVVAGSDAVVTRTFDPPITALDLSPEANARSAVNALVGQLEGRAARWPLPGAENPLIVRGSTRGPG